MHESAEGTRLSVEQQREGARPGSRSLTRAQGESASHECSLSGKADCRSIRLSADFGPELVLENAGGDERINREQRRTERLSSRARPP